MAVDLFSLRLNLEIGGAAQAKSALQEIDAIGRRTAQAMQGLGTDARLATSHFLTGRIGLTDFRTALAVAGEQAVALQGRWRGLATVAAGTFKGIGDAAVAGFVRARNALGGFVTSTFGAIITITGLVAAYRSLASAADELTRSQLALQGASRLAGVPLADVQRLSAQVAAEFKMSQRAANDFVGEFIRIGFKARDLNAMIPAMRNFLNVGAQMGMSASETLFRVHQAVIGIDEGTDNLFRKNPSVIYKEYAREIGIAVGKMTDQQKMMAILNEAEKVAANDRQAYTRFLDTVLGKQAAFNARLEDARAAFGTALGPLRLFAYEIGTTLLNNLQSAWIGLTNGLTGWKNLFTLALPGIVQLGAGRMLLILADFAGSVVRLFSRLGINIGVGVVAAMGEAGARLVQAGRGDLSKWDAQRRTVVDAMRAAAEGGAPVDMTPVVFPALSQPESEPTESAEDRAKRIMGLANMDEAMKPPSDLGPPPGTRLSGPLGLRMDVPSGIQVAGGNFSQAGPTGERRFGILEDFRLRAAQEAAALQQQFMMLGSDLGMVLANGFASAIGAAMRGKNPLKAFGNVILQGLGSIFSQMGQKLVAFGITMLKLLPFLSNPFTSGPAAIAAGILLMGLGAALGAIATGDGGGGGGGAGGDFRDRATVIRLSADGLGGSTAPEREPGQKIEVLGIHSPEGQRVAAAYVMGAKRRNLL